MNIPNILTVIRFVCIPCFIGVFFSDLPDAGLISLCIFLFAMALDVADGFIARKFDMITDLGKAMDPVADKLLVISVVTCLVMDGRIPLWFLLFVIGKELLMMLGWLILYRGRKVVVPANIFGKLATFFMFLYLVDSLRLGVFLTLFQWGAVISTALAFVMYGINFIKIRFAKG
ncbi:MAG: CDP-alcohol phosphatidyltransferase family protein [Ruminococcaceae bacterium]|nr:CDP-alcohol phosphatidyltransferase family protein [Oscillospiraceae bacterium]